MVRPVWLSNFPLPPSVNNYLSIVRGRHVKTQVHRDFRDLCYLWAARNQRSFHPVKDQLRRMILEQNRMFGHIALRVDCFFAFDQSRIFDKQDGYKQLDADGRLKPLWDGLAAILDIDDRFFFAGNCEKVWTTDKGGECSLIRIEQMKPRSLLDVKILMDIEILGS